MSSRNNDTYKQLMQTKLRQRHLKDLEKVGKIIDYFKVKTGQVTKVQCRVNH